MSSNALIEPPSVTGGPKRLTRIYKRINKKLTDASNYVNIAPKNQTSVRYFFNGYTLYILYIEGVSEYKSAVEHVFQTRYCARNNCVCTTSYNLSFTLQTNSFLNLKAIEENLCINLLKLRYSVWWFDGFIKRRNVVRGSIETFTSRILLYQWSNCCKLIRDIGVNIVVYKMRKYNIQRR